MKGLEEVESSGAASQQASANRRGILLLLCLIPAAVPAPTAGTPVQMYDRGKLSWHQTQHLNRQWPRSNA
jgi:hypothetical protein